MEKFLLILLICTIIIEIIFAAGQSQKDKGKRKLDEFLEINSSSSNKFSQKSIKKPIHNFDLNNSPETDDEFDSFNEENVQHSSSAQQNSPSNNNILSTVLKFSNPTSADDHAHQSQIEPIIANQPIQFQQKSEHDRLKEPRCQEEQRRQWRMRKARYRARQRQNPNQRVIQIQQMSEQDRLRELECQEKKRAKSQHRKEFHTQMKEIEKSDDKITSAEREMNSERQQSNLNTIRMIKPAISPHSNTEKLEEIRNGKKPMCENNKDVNTDYELELWPFAYTLKKRVKNGTEISKLSKMTVEEQEEFDENKKFGNYEYNHFGSGKEKLINNYRPQYWRCTKLNRCKCKGKIATYTYENVEQNQNNENVQNKNNENVQNKNNENVQNKNNENVQNKNNENVQNKNNENVQNKNNENVQNKNNENVQNKNNENVQNKNNENVQNKNNENVQNKNNENVQNKNNENVQNKNNENVQNKNNENVQNKNNENVQNKNNENVQNKNNENVQNKNNENVQNKNNERHYRRTALHSCKMEEHSIRKGVKVCVKSNNQELNNYSIIMYCNDVNLMTLSLWEGIQEKGKYCNYFLVDLQFCVGGDLFFQVTMTNQNFPSESTAKGSDESMDENDQIAPLVKGHKNPLNENEQIAPLAKRKRQTNQMKTYKLVKADLDKYANFLLHWNNEKKIFCDNCGYATKWNYNLVRHQQNKKSCIKKVNTILESDEMAMN